MSAMDRRNGPAGWGMRLFGMDAMTFIGIILTIIAIAGIGYSLHICQCDQKLAFLSKADLNVSYVGNDTVIVIKGKHIEVVDEAPEPPNQTTIDKAP